MYFILVLIIGTWIGYKLRGAVEIYRQVKQVKYIEKIVDRILSDKEVKIIDFKKTKRRLVSDPREEDIENDN